MNFKDFYYETFKIEGLYGKFEEAKEVSDLQFKYFKKLNIKIDDIQFYEVPFSFEICGCIDKFKVFILRYHNRKDILKNKSIKEVYETRLFLYRGKNLSGNGIGYKIYDFLVDYFGYLLNDRIQYYPERSIWFKLSKKFNSYIINIKTLEIQEFKPKSETDEKIWKFEDCEIAENYRLIISKDKIDII